MSRRTQLLSLAAVGVFLLYGLVMAGQRPAANPAHAQIRQEVIDDLTAKGLITRIDCARGVAHIPPVAWRAIDADNKASLAKMVWDHCTDRGRYLALTLIDAQSGRELAGYSQFSGFSVR